MSKKISPTRTFLFSLSLSIYSSAICFHSLLINAQKHGSSWKFFFFFFILFVLDTGKFYQCYSYRKIFAEEKQERLRRFFFFLFFWCSIVNTLWWRGNFGQGNICALIGFFSFHFISAWKFDLIRRLQWWTTVQVKLKWHSTELWPIWTVVLSLPSLTF